LNPTIPIDKQQILKLKGITEKAVDTLGIVRIYFFSTPVTFHVIDNHFPIAQQGILGSSFF
ncbi:hypothetical protein EAI_00005, partial [Harpegnathos saltator]